MLEEIAKEYEIELEELKKVEIELQQKYKALPDIAIIKGTEEQFIRKGLITHAKKIKKLKAEQLFGIILEFEAPKSSNKKKISESIVEFKKDPEKAVNSGQVMQITEDTNTHVFHCKKLMTTGKVGTKNETTLPDGALSVGDGVYIIPLDTRKTFGTKSNWRYLKPLEPDAHFTGLGGLLLIDGTTQKFKMSINFDGSDFKVPMNVPVKFRAEIHEIKNGMYTLKYKKGVTDFEVMPGDLSTLQKLITEYRTISSISEVPEIHKSKYGDPIAICGTATEIWMGRVTDEKPHPQNTIVIEDVSSDSPIKVNMHHELPIDYAIGSIIIVWGRTGKGDKWDKDARQTIKGEVEYNIWGSGSYPLVKIGPSEPPAPVGSQGTRSEEWT